jgi:uncharacterized protein
MLKLKPERLDVGEFSEQPVSICGRAFIADISGALYWPGEDALIVSDLHLEKASAQVSEGVFTPSYDTRATLERLAEVIDRYGASTVICLGGSRQDSGAGGRLNAEDLETLTILQEDHEWIWIAESHDREILASLGGHVRENLDVGGLALRHNPASSPVTHEIAGCLRPAARLSYYGHVIRRPAFIGNGLRLVMPAFGTYTGGLNVLDEAFAPLFGNGGFNVWAMGQEGLYPVATRLLKED